MSSLKERVGREIRRLRENHGLSLQVLGDSAGVSEATMISIEKGRSATNLEILERIAKQLGVHPADLLRPDSPPTLRAAEPTGDPLDGLSSAGREKMLALIEIEKEAEKAEKKGDSKQG